MSNTLKNNILSGIISFVFLLVALFLVSACSSGGGSQDPVPDVDLSGFYAGTATIDSLDVTDLKVIASNNQLIITSVDNDLLYVATVSSLSGNEFTASVRIYLNGDFLSTATATGTATASSSMTGTISGTGPYTSGTFNLTYSLVNSRTPLVFDNTISWLDSSPQTAELEFSPDGTMYVTLGATSSSTIAGCYIDGTTLVDVDSEQPGRIRSFSDSFASCSDTSIAGTVTQGFMTTFDGTDADDTMLFVIHTDNSAQVSILNLINL